MFEKGKVYASGSNKSSDRVGVFQKGKVYEGGGGNLYDMQQLVDKTVTNPTEAFRQNVGGNPIPHVNPTKPAKNSPVSGELTLTDKLNIGNISEKLRAGIDLNKTERETVSRVGLDSIMSGKADGTFDLNAADSPNNRARLSRVKAIIAKQKAGKEITENENDTLETFKLLNNYKKMSASENSVMTGDYNENARKMNEGLAGKLYNDTAYGNKHFKVGSKEFTVNEKDSAQVALGNMQQTKNRIKLYADTGAEQYVKGIDTTIGVLTGKSPKEIAAEPDSAYAMVSALLKEHFAQRGDKFSSAVQDIVTNMANNAPAMIIGSAAGLAGLPAAAASAVGTSSFAVTVFGNAYKEAVQLGATDNQGKLIAYALADTALECGLEYLIGGIPGVGGVLSGNLISDVSKQFSDVFMKAIVKTVGNGAGEFVEEGTQTILAPLLQKWLLGADVETVADNPLEQLSQAAYDGFIGFMSSVFMGAGTQLQGAAVEQNIQEYGKRYKSKIGQSNADIKEIARYFAEVSEKNSDLRKAAEAVAKGDTSDFSVGNMMCLGINYSKNSTEQIYRKVGEVVRNSEGGISGLLESYKLLTENGLIFPEKTEGLYSDISATLESGFEVSDEMLGEFAMQVQTYSPRAVMMRELTKEAEVKADTETQPTVKESVFDEVSAQKPEYDLIEDWAYTSKGKTRLTDEQKKIAKIGKALGWDVEFDAVHIKDKNGKTVRGENGMPRRADGSIDIKNKRITIDYENKQPIQFIFKHELTHFGESSKLYGDFTEAVEKSKLFEKWLGEKTGKQGSTVRLKAQLLNDIMSTRTNAGAAVDISGARAEMIADFVGDALFSDNGSGLEGIIKNADTKERGAIRQFLHDFISYLKKKISGNREISFEISKLEDMFNRMFTDVTEKTSDSQTEKFSIAKDNDGNNVVVIDTDQGLFVGAQKSAYSKIATDYLNKHFANVVLQLSEYNAAEVNKTGIGKYVYSGKPTDTKTYSAKMKAATELENLLKIAEYTGNSEDNKAHGFAKNGFDYYKTTFIVDGQVFEGIIDIGVSDDKATFYGMSNIKRVTSDFGRYSNLLLGYNSESMSRGNSYDITVSQNEQYVNTNIYGEEEKNTSDNQTEKYSINNVEFSQSDFDKNIETISNMQSVANLTGNEFAKGEKNLVTQVNEFFEKYGNSVENSILGDVDITSRGVKDSMAHGLGRNKAIAFAAVPDVIRDGKIIDYQKNWKGRGYDTVILAAPISISGKAYYEGVIVTRNANTQRFYVHEVITEERTEMPFKTGNANLSAKPGGNSSPSVISLLDKIRNVKENSNKKRVSNWEMRTGLQLPVGSSLTNSNNSISNNDTSVNTNISENTQNDTEKYSIETESTDKTEDFDKIADLVNHYNNGEISKNEYYEQMREKWREAGEKYGTIPEGENAAEDYGVPNAAKDGAPTRRYVRTVLETGSLTDSMKDQIGAEILQGNFSYSPISDENAIKSADKAIESGEAEKRWKAAIESKNISKKTIAIGERLLADAIKVKDNARVLELSAELSDVLTRAGQVVQSARLLKQMTGVGRLVALQRTVQTLNADLAKRFGDKAPVIQIDENVAQIMAESQTEEEIERAYRETVQDIADQVPATFLDKWNAWRYFAMLANPRTHIRNIVGNTIFIPAVRAKDVIATGIERIAQLGNSEVERTKVAAVKKEYREFAKNDANNKEVKALLRGQKYDERSQLYEMRRTFKNNALEFLTSFNGNLLEAEDLLFKNRHYIHALGSFLQARKADLNNVSESLMFEARSYAVKEAQKATFNDESAIANYLKSITRIKDKDTTALKVAKIAIDGVIPFKRTPVNIIRRGIEYSPIGLGKALTAGLYDVKKGKISISEFADGLAAGLTGTGIFAIGLLLSGLGYVNGGFGDDDEDKFKKLNGEQEYSVRVFGKSYTIDWAAPACIPFFIGVETANSFKDGNGVKLSDFTGALWNSLEPVTNLSMLSGIQNTISAAKYSSASETLASIGEDIALSYAMQGIPSLAGSISRTIDPTQRSWYTDKNSSISKFGQEAINNIESKIPGVSYFQAPSIDQWGRIKKRGKLAERLTENFLSPGYYSDIEYDDVNSELKRIIEKTSNTKVVPKKAPTSFNVNKKQKFLTAKEYTTFAAAKGQMSFDYVKEFIETPAYKKLTDEQRIEVISCLYEYAGAKAKTTVSDYDLMKSYKTVTNLERNGTSAVYYYISRTMK